MPLFVRRMLLWKRQVTLDPKILYENGEPGFYIAFTLNCITLDLCPKRVNYYYQLLANKVTVFHCSSKILLLKKV